MSAPSEGRPVKVRRCPMKRRSDAKLANLPERTQQEVLGKVEHLSLSAGVRLLRAYGIQTSEAALSTWLAERRAQRGPAHDCQCSVLVVWEKPARWEILKLSRVLRVLNRKDCRKLSVALNLAAHGPANGPADGKMEDHES